MCCVFYFQLKCDPIAKAQRSQKAEGRRQKFMIGKKLCADYQNYTQSLNQHILFWLRPNFKETPRNGVYEWKKKGPGH